MNLQTQQVNRLAESDSPYLIQHAENPVNWFPWGEEAFTQARELDRPIFLSIGYSTCHWCHVMAEESFEDEEVANLLNKRFVPIKVDREERPDIDMFYINACQAVTGSAGWPLTAICTPEGHPFFLGTYFPPRTKQGRLGLVEILTSVSEQWKKSRSEVEQTARDIMARAKSIVTPPRAATYTSERLFQRAVDGLKGSFDQDFGGFGRAPKFPTPTNILLLLRHWDQTGDVEAKGMVETTLTAMYRGGIFDHIGYGFHRYSTDQQWLVPHFEKMLYDNALMAIVYLEAFQAFGRPIYRTNAQKIFRYVLRDMQHPDGGFYSAEDADSEGVEGQFYLWRRSEILHALPSPIGEQFCQLYDITDEGNFEGENIPNLLGALDNELEDTQTMEPWLEELQRRRTHRTRPGLDDKILTAWNGLMIGALARGFQLLGNEQYLQAAKAAAQFIMENLVDGDGRLYTSFRKRRGPLGFLDDYAFFSFGLLELYQASHEERYLLLAEQFMADLLELFTDKSGPSLFFSAEWTHDLPVRPKSFEDGAQPSGTAVTLWNLTKLAILRPQAQWESALKELAKDLPTVAADYPWHFPALVMGLHMAQYRPLEITFTGDLKSSAFAELWAALHSHYWPDAVIKFDPHSNADQCQVHVCMGQRCLPPISDPNQLLEILEKEKASI